MMVKKLVKNEKILLDDSLLEFSLMLALENPPKPF